MRLCNEARENEDLRFTESSELPMASDGNDEDIPYSFLFMGCFSRTGNDPANCYQIKTSDVLQEEAQLKRISGQASSGIPG
jgi:hypothetical protein